MNKFDAFGEDRELLRRDEGCPPARAVAAPAEGKPKDVLEDLTWKILSATDSDDIRGYVIQAAAHGVELGRAETASTPPPAATAKLAEQLYEILFSGNLSKEIALRYIQDALDFAVATASWKNREALNGRS